MMSIQIDTAARSGLRWAVFSLAATVAILAVTNDPASARRHHRQHASHTQRTIHVSHSTRVSRPARKSRSVRAVRSSRGSYNPPYSSIVVDANTGAVLQASQADGSRHPASLTKIMTLYLLFERLEAGRLNLNTQLPISQHASVQSPTKLGLKAGQSIAVETAIKGIVTRSANDAAVVIAEALGGSESGFARMMTQKAHALGMSRTVYVNASGLPDDAQITTARDQAILGRAIQERFPHYYRYFSTASFEYRGHSIANHNHLLGSVEGVDGIKTGYTHDSGFNLVTSMWRGRRHLVAVVMGGRSAGQRDAKMRELLAENIMLASVNRTGTAIAKAPAEDNDQRVAYAQERMPAALSKPMVLHKLAQAEEIAANEPPQTAFRAVAATGPTPGSTDPIKPLLVKTVSVKPVAREAAKAAPKAALKVASLAARADAPKFTASLPARRPEPVRVADTSSAQASVHDSRAPAHKSEPVQEKGHSGWMIQVGAFDAEREARKRLSSAQNRAKRLLGEADPFTETVTKGEKTLYRARFAGLDKEQAEAACRTLKRNEISCLALKN